MCIILKKSFNYDITIIRTIYNNININNINDKIEIDIEVYPS